MEKDHVDRLIELWSILEPESDTSPLQMGARLLRAAQRLETSIEDALRPLEISFADFDVINAIRREGGDTGLTPTQLATFALVTSGAMTARIDRLERMGLVERSPDRDDRRAIRVALTDRGRDVAKRGFDAVIETHRRFLEKVPGGDQATVAEILRRLLLDLDEPLLASRAGSRRDQVS